MKDGDVQLGVVTQGPIESALGVTQKCLVQIDGASTAVPAFAGGSTVKATDKVSVVYVRGELYIVGVREAGSYYEERLLSAQSIAAGGAAVAVTVGSLRVLRNGPTAWVGNTWTAPEDAPYNISFNCNFTTSIANSDLLVAIYGSGVGAFATAEGVSNSGQNGLSITATKWFSAGDNITVRVRQSSGSAKTIDNSTNPSYVSIAQL